jgi:hypothetical protein
MDTLKYRAEWLVDKTITTMTHCALPFAYYAMKACDRAGGWGEESWSGTIISRITPEGDYMDTPAKVFIAAGDLLIMATTSNAALQAAVASNYTGSMAKVAVAGFAAPLIFANALGLAEGLRYDIPTAFKTARAELPRRIKAPLRRSLERKLEARKKVL